MSLIRFSKEEDQSYQLLIRLISSLCQDFFEKNPDQVTQGDRNYPGFEDISLSGKTFVSYCKKITAGAKVSIREGSLDVMVQRLTGNPELSWREWKKMQLAEMATAAQVLAPVGQVKVEEGSSRDQGESLLQLQPRHAEPLSYRRGILLAGLISGVLSGMFYLMSQDFFAFDRATFEARNIRYGYAMDRILGVWFGHMLGGSFAGLMLGVIPQWYRQKPSKSARRQLLLLTFLVSFIIFTLVIVSAERTFLHPCNLEEGYGFLSNWDFKGIGLALACTTGLLSLIPKLSKKPERSFAENLVISIQAGLVALLVYLFVFNLYRFLGYLGVAEKQSWLIPCWLRFYFGNLNRVWLVPVLGFVYVFTLLNVPMWYQRLVARDQTPGAD
ncbi:MAG: hypothetical protein AAFR61_25575 [Bacteroidota bacterium]